LPAAVVSLSALVVACSTGRHGDRNIASPKPQPIYRPSGSIPCLNVIGTIRISAKFGADPEITEELDSIGQSAGLKAIDLNLGSNSAEVVFEKSVSQARKANTTASFWVKNYRSKAKVVQRRNVVVIFRKRPSAGEEKAVFGCMNTSRPIARPVLSQLKAAMKADDGKGGFCWNDCPGLRIAAGRVSVAHPAYVSVDAGEPVEGGAINWVSAIFHRESGRWKIVDYGTGEVGCEKAPPSVLRDLGFGCPLY
jgi:hypothetical protein